MDAVKNINNCNKKVSVSSTVLKHRLSVSLSSKTYRSAFYTYNIKNNKKFTIKNIYANHKKYK